MVALVTWLGVALCGALGAVARFRVDAALSARLATDFPLGTLAVNLSGALALGVVLGAGVADRAVLLAGGGFLGGYTTFSTWMVESERLGEDGDVLGLLGNLFLSLALGFAAAALGWGAGRAIG